MWQNKKKALTFSFDDGTLQDRRLVELMDKYGLRGTFNLNSAFLGKRTAKKEVNGHTVDYSRVNPTEIQSLYRKHEIASHTLAHLSLTELSDEGIVWQVEKDRKLLSILAGYEVVGFAYPYGCYDERVLRVLKENTGIKYARIVGAPLAVFDKANEIGDLMCYNPTLHICQTDKMMEMGRAFVRAKPEEPILFCVWGHAYELDEGKDVSWEDIEAFFALVSGQEDIFYGTNREVFLGDDCLLDKD